MAAVISVVISMVMLLLGRKITGLFVDHSSPDAGEVLNYAYHYLVVLSLFLVILYCLHIYRSALQGMGNTIIPLISGFVELTMRLLTALFFCRGLLENMEFILLRWQPGQGQPCFWSLLIRSRYTASREKYSYKRGDRQGERR